MTKVIVYHFNKTYKLKIKDEGNKNYNYESNKNETNDIHDYCITKADVKINDNSHKKDTSEINLLYDEVQKALDLQNNIFYDKIKEEINRKYKIPIDAQFLYFNKNYYLFTFGKKLTNFYINNRVQEKKSINEKYNSKMLEYDTNYNNMFKIQYNDSFKNLLQADRNNKERIENHIYKDKYNNEQDVKNDLLKRHKTSFTNTKNQIKDNIMNNFEYSKDNNELPIVASKITDKTSKIIIEPIKNKKCLESLDNITKEKILYDKENLNESIVEIELNLLKEIVPFLETQKRSELFSKKKESGTYKNYTAFTLFKNFVRENKKIDENLIEKDFEKIVHKDLVNYINDIFDI